MAPIRDYVVASMRRVARRHGVESRLSIMDPVAPDIAPTVIAVYHAREKFRP